MDTAGERVVKSSFNHNSYMLLIMGNIYVERRREPKKARKTILELCWESKQGRC